MDLTFADLKKEYASLEKKFKLPQFEKINEDFEIGKIDRDVGAFLRSVRKLMMEKIVNSLSFVEMLLNPMNAPRMYITYLNGLSIEDRNKIDSIYSKLSDLSILSLEREIKYEEKSEAELILKIFTVWATVKNDFLDILKNMKAPASSVKKERTYFG